MTGGGKASILIVEDDAIIAEDIARQLESLGFSVCGILAKGEEVGSAVAENCPDLVIIDLVLAGMMDGIAATEAIHQHSDIPVIFLTGRSDVAVHEHTLRADPIAFLFKPIQTARLGIQIDIALQRHAMKRRLRESIALLEATIESTADGLLVVDLDRRIVLLNRQCIKIWGIPADLAASNDDSKLTQHILPQLVDPARFLAEMQMRDRDPEQESKDTLERKDGSTIERCSRPYFIGSEVHGRVWSFRDVTLNTRAQRCLEQFNDRLELLVNKRTEDLEAANAGLRREAIHRKLLERQILSISEREQQRLGRDLHDGICQELAGINFSLEAMVKKMSRRSTVRPRLQTIAENVRETMLHTRLLSRGLAPTVLESGNLAFALADLTSNAATLFGLSCPFETEGDQLDALDRDIAINLYRIAQEALQNAVKHGGASEVRMTLRRQDGEIQLVIQDNGAGLAETPPAREPSGMGLKIMHHRASLLGGVVEIFSPPGAGARVECSIPQ